MGFKSVMKKVGKVALKAAPFALDFLPGGQIAHMALAAGLGGLDSAVHHKGLKGILGGAALGAGTEFGASKLLGAAKGAKAATGAKSMATGIIDPSLKDIASGAAFHGVNDVAKTGLKSTIKGFGSSLLKNPTLPLAALSMLQKDPQPQRRQSYHGDLTNPEDSLYQALSATYRAGQGMMEKKPVRLRGLLPDAPQPVSIPGLGFQIGGGMGHNPAQDDMEVDSMDGYRNYDPFQSVAPGQFAAAKKKTGL